MGDTASIDVAKAVALIEIGTSRVAELQTGEYVRRRG